MGKKRKGTDKISAAERKIKKLEKEVREKERVIEEYKDRLLRQRAEFENYQKKLEKEKEEFRKEANASLIKDLLIILDDFERAIQELKKRRDKKMKEGIKLIYKNFEKILEERGLKPIKAVGEKFDPYYHEALLQEESDKEDGLILEELQKGYLLNDKVLRYSKVKVSKKKKKS